MNRQKKGRLIITGALCLLALSACSYSIEKAFHSQANDGYIVGGSVFCDDEANGSTSSAGQLTCPHGTRIVEVRGGLEFEIFSQLSIDEFEDGSKTNDLCGASFKGYVSYLYS